VLTLRALMAKPDSSVQSGELERKHAFSSASKAKDTGLIVHQEEAIRPAYDAAWERIKELILQYQDRGSGWRLKRCVALTLKMTTYKPFAGAAWLPLPQWVVAKKAVVNVKNRDGRCLEYALLAALHADEVQAHRDRPGSWRQWLGTLDFTGISFPVTAASYERVEQLNALPFNVWGIAADASGPEDIELEYSSQLGGDTMPVDLLRVYSGDAGHFCWVSRPDALFCKSATSRKRCSRCLVTFSSAQAFNNHRAAAGKCQPAAAAGGVVKVLPKAGEQGVRFTNIRHQLRAPFALYAHSVPLVGADGAHRAAAVQAVLVSDQPEQLAPAQRLFEGDSCVADFLKWTQEVEAKAQAVVRQNKPMQLLPHQEQAFQLATRCYLCKTPFKQLKALDKHGKPRRNAHRDHCHLTGRFRGAACARCNINFSARHWNLPCFVHGLKEYDGHLLLAHAGSVAEVSHVIPDSSQRYSSFRVGNVCFKDSSAFLDAPRVELVEMTRRSGVDVPATANEAQQLALCFEAFRSTSQRESGLDAAHYYSAAGLSFDSMLRSTGARLDAFHEGQADMLEFMQRSMRGGLCLIPQRHARANNPLVPGYDSSRPTSWILLFDCNSLYPAAMRLPMPTGGFTWESDLSRFDSEFFLALQDDDDGGFFVECDLDYPERLHDAHADFPLAPEHRSCEPSPAMAALAAQLGLPVSSGEKLVATLHDKERYVVHSRFLRTLLEQGLQLRAVHRVLSFEADAVVQPYVDAVAEKRRTAATPVEAAFHKLRLNSLWGKCCECVENRVDVKLVTSAHPEKLVRLASRPQFRDSRRISDDLMAVDLSLSKVAYNKPVAVGAAVLDISKALMAEAWYTQFQRIWPNAHLLFSDTDSFCVHVECEDPAADMKANAELFDLTGGKEPGLFKLELGGPERPIAEFVGLRQKCYSILLADGSVGKITAAGVPSAEAAKLQHAAYRAALGGAAGERLTYTARRAVDHVVRDVTVSRAGLSAVDTSRYVLPDGVSTLPHGHCGLRAAAPRAAALRAAAPQAAAPRAAAPTDPCATPTDMLEEA